MWTILAFLLLSSTLDLGAARSSFPKKDVEREVNGTESAVQVSVDGSTRFPSELPQADAQIKRLHIRNQTGFDGKVRSIRFDTAEDENKPGIRAYGLPKKHLEDSGLIERIPLEQPYPEDTRNSRLIEAYGMAKRDFENNGEIERVIVPISVSQESRVDPKNREARSIDGRSESNAERNPEGSLEDLEAQSAKVFRPLFVYRKQQAKKQRLHNARSNPQSLYHEHGKSYNHYGNGY